MWLTRDHTLLPYILTFPFKNDACSTSRPQVSTPWPRVSAPRYACLHPDHACVEARWIKGSKINVHVKTVEGDITAAKLKPELYRLLMNTELLLSWLILTPVLAFTIMIANSCTVPLAFLHMLHVRGSFQTQTETWNTFKTPSSLSPFKAPCSPPPENKPMWLYKFVRAQVPRSSVLSRPEVNRDWVWSRILTTWNYAFKKILWSPMSSD